jgi:cytochrome c-type biogenesis protein CcmH/NrfG
MIEVRSSINPVSKDSILFGVAGVFFGVLVGWIIGSQQAVDTRSSAAAAAPAAAEQPAARQQTAAPLDERRAASLKETADRDPKDARSRIELGNVYFDAERFDDASKWYEAALTIEPRNVSVSTDLGISYYYMNQPDRALAQFERSLGLDPTHAKTLLNVGIVRAYGKDDLPGAVKAWQRVVELGPDTPEGKVAKQALDAVRNSHPNLAGPAPDAKGPGGS